MEEGKQNIVLVDFEEAEVELRQPIGTSTPNRKRKRCKNIPKGGSEDKYSAELRRVQRYFLEMLGYHLSGQKNNLLLNSTWRSFYFI